jgi:hypothetical protein
LDGGCLTLRDFVGFFATHHYYHYHYHYYFYHLLAHSMQAASKSCHGLD